MTIPSDPVTASIRPRPIVVKADDKSSRKGEAMAELTYSIDASTPLVEGDTLASLGITASTTATSSSDVGEYPITLAGGTANPNYTVTFGEGAKYTITEPAKVAIHRLYNPNSGEHFFTSNTGERDSVVAAGWIYEGVGWTAPAKGEPVYRLYNEFGGEHHYTPSKNEHDVLVGLGWKDEGIGWRTADASGVPLYRQYNPNAFSCNHNFTTSTNERDTLLGLGWRDEGIAWYGARVLK